MTPLNEILEHNPNLKIVARGPAGVELYDKASGQYFTYDIARGIHQTERGIEPAYPDKLVMRKSYAVIKLLERVIQLERGGTFEPFGAKSLKNLALRSHVLANISESQVARAGSFFKIHSYVEQALFKLDVNTELDSATFWSGKDNQQRATSFATNMHKKTLEMTTGGEYLDSLDLFKKSAYEQAVKPWDALSKRFAENASGDVYAFVEGTRPTSVFNRIEYLILIENPKVNEIVHSSNGIIFRP